MLTSMGATIITDPVTAKKTLLAMFKAQKGNREAVATAFNVDVRSVYRWLTRLDAWAELDTMIEREGFPRVPGPPRMRDRIVSALVEARGAPARAARALELAGGKDELLARVTELHLLATINTSLEAAGHPQLPAPK